METLNPLFGISAAMKNRDKNESLTFREGLDLYTRNAARASPITSDCGEIARGKKCDLVVLDCDNPNVIRNANVVATFVNGTIQYSIKPKMSTSKYSIS